MGILSTITGFVGVELPDHFTFLGKRYPLTPLFKYIDEHEAEMLPVLLEVLHDSVPVPKNVQAEVVSVPSGLSAPTEPAVAYPTSLLLEVRRGFYHKDLGGGEIDSERLAKWQRGQENINKLSRVWFDATPSPDTVKEIPEMLLNVEWEIDHDSTIYTWKGDGTYEVREDGRKAANGGPAEVFGMSDGVFRMAYFNSNGYYIPLKFTKRGVYFVRATIRRPDGLVIQSNEIGPLTVR